MEETSQTIKKPRRRVRFFTVFLILVLFGAVFFQVNFKTVEVKGQSMEPTLKSGQRVLATKAYGLVGEIKKNDIIVLSEEQSNGYFIKRVYGLPGDEIPWAFAPQDWPLENGKFVVPEGKVYVVGDNILHSDDSRKFGPFRLAKVLGKVVTWR